MLEKYDELNRDRAERNVFYNFIEPKMIPKFMPTYKKYETRKAVPLLDPVKWVKSTYRTIYKVPFYKKGPKMQKVNI